MLSLARLQLARGNFEACQLQCALLKTDRTTRRPRSCLRTCCSNRSSMTSHIPLSTAAGAAPDHWAALVMLLRLLRKAGRLTDAPRFLKYVLGGGLLSLFVCASCSALFRFG